MQTDSSSENKSFETIELLPIEELFTGIQSPFDSDTVSKAGVAETKSPESDHEVSNVVNRDPGDLADVVSNVAEKPVFLLLWRLRQVPLNLLAYLWNGRSREWPQSL